MKPSSCLSFTCLLALATLAGCDAPSSTEPEAAPTATATATATVLAVSFYQMAADGFNMCGVTTDKQAYCWGGGEVP